MASRSPSRSEGEVVSSDSEAKANTSRSMRNDTKVDRHTRPYLAPYTPPAKRHHSRSRSRSPSPYRAPRGEKRRREDEQARDIPHHDPRTFHVRYEDDRSSHRRHDSRYYHRSKRSRTYSRSRSPSPYRHQRDESREEKDATAGGSDGSRHQRFQSVETPTAKEIAKQTKDTRSVEVKVKALKHSQTEISRYNDSTQGAATNYKPALDEAALIEERRKRRDAIKNKYRGQATPLLVQALHLGADSSHDTPGFSSTPSSPGRSGPNTSAEIDDVPSTRDGSPVAESPRSSGTAGPNSPGDFASPKTEDFADVDPGSPTEDEPSAADYDPTIDMQEERARHDKRLFKEDDKSLAEADQHVPYHGPMQDQAVASKSKAEFDMFAEEEDDDMFSEAPKKPDAEIKAPQALDARMMDNWDDDEGYYVTILGELIDGRYQVTQNLGRGMFSSVVRATDSQMDQVVAIKILRNNESMRKAGVKEIDILKDIAANDPEDRKHVIRLLRSFDHKGHLCMVFENLSMNLREVLKKFGRDVGINLRAIRAYAQQLFLGLSLLKKCQYLHADLKPDNILVNESRNMLKVCDLGSASPISENATAPYLVSRFYRAPEVILGIPYDYSIDMWSIGCTLFELYTGKILFAGRNNNDMLKAIMDCRGKFSHKLLRRGALTYDYFDDLLNFRSEQKDKVTGRIITRLVDIKAKPIRDLRSRLVPKGKRLEEQERKETQLFLDLLEKCLALSPDKRITPLEALKHPFIVKIKA